MKFELGQVFDKEYPAEAAEWCNQSLMYHIDEIEKGSDGQRRFQIVSNAQPTDEQKSAWKLAEETSVEARIAALEDALAEMMGGNA